MEGAPGSEAWTDVTVVPGLRPRMRTTRSQRPERWVEEGRFGPFRARLELRFVPDGDVCRVRADFTVGALGAGPLLTLAARPAVGSDLRRAARILGRS